MSDAPSTAATPEDPAPASSRSLRRQETGSSTATSSATDSGPDDLNERDSSEGGKGGGSGTGYAADCSSASDQSSDDTAGGGSSSRMLPLHRPQVSIEGRTMTKDRDAHHGKTPCDSRQPSSKGDALKSTHRSRQSERGHCSTQPQGQDALLDLQRLLRATLRHDNVDTELPPGPRPQWNGVRLTDVMDPRFDSNRHDDAAFREQLARQLAALLAPPRAPDATVTDHAAEAAATAHQQSVDHYLMLQELCRPFYQSLALPLVAKRKDDGDAVVKDGKGTDVESDPSSEGFTSFFTTTHSSNNGSSSDGDKNRQNADAKQSAPHDDNAGHDKRKKEETSSGDSSKVGGNSSDGSAPERQARIQLHNERDPSFASENNVNGSSMSSESSASPGGRLGHDQRPGHIPRIVTESSGTNTNSASGGSTANHASGMSNLGSSGSGNDKGSSEEGKGTGSSEELAAKDNNSGTNDGSDEADSSMHEARIGAETGSTEPEHRVSVHKSHPMKPGDDLEMEDAAREHKLLDKKRKRIEMRREYEAQQHSESSESSNDPKHVDVLRPGKSYTLEQVLQFSEIPRILVQSRPPFLVVHTNAAYSRLTGIDSHKVVGKPVRALLSIQSGARHKSNSEAESTLDGLSETEIHHQVIRLERLIASSGFGKVHDILVNVAPHRLLGTNVSFVQAGSVDGTDFVITDAGAVTGNYDGAQFSTCKASIAPILSPFEICTSVVSDKDGPYESNKRRKHGTSSHDSLHRKQPHQSQARITHFVVQLFPADSTNGETADSISSGSTSVQARLLGLSKEMLLAQRKATHPHSRDLRASAEGGAPIDSDEDEENLSESTDQTKLAVSAIG